LGFGQIQFNDGVNVVQQLNCHIRNLVWFVDSGIIILWTKSLCEILQTWYGSGINWMCVDVLLFCVRKWHVLHCHWNAAVWTLRQCTVDLLNASAARWQIVHLPDTRQPLTP